MAVHRRQFTDRVFHKQRQLASYLKVPTCHGYRFLAFKTDTEYSKPIIIFIFYQL